MAPALLSRKGLGPRCMEVLETHGINSIEVFRMLREEHVVKLQEEGLSVGIHAKLWQLWEQEHQGFNSGQLLACWVTASAEFSFQFLQSLFRILISACHFSIISAAEEPIQLLALTY